MYGFLNKPYWYGEGVWLFLEVVELAVRSSIGLSARRRKKKIGIAGLLPRADTTVIIEAEEMVKRSNTENRNACFCIRTSESDSSLKP